MSTLLPTLALTVGDPSGIGPEIVVKALRDPRVVDACRPVIYGPYEPQDLEAFPAGRVSADSATVACEAITRATQDALAEKVDAIVTAPINKTALAAAGLPWRGHTDFLAHLCGTKQVAMMFWSERLRVVLATVHVPLAEVPRALTRSRLVDVIRLTAGWLPRFGFPSPRVAVTGLNPHAGEGGVLGNEEIEVIEPAIAETRAEGIRVAGPFPADTLFVRAARGEFDAVVAAYHDQGLIPVKLIAFGRSVNVTLGLPIIRTSVDHGTAFDIARRGVADEGSLVEAILLAARLVGTRNAERGTRNG